MSALTAPAVLPIVSTGLRPIETYLQLFDALEHLDRAIGDVYGKIADRVRTRLQKCQLLPGQARSLGIPEHSHRFLSLGTH
jgi:hypothetical protein